MFADFLGALGFSNGNFQNALIVGASSPLEFRTKNSKPRTHFQSLSSSKQLGALQYSLAVFVADSDLRMSHVISSARYFLDQFKASGQKFQRQRDSRHRFQQSFSSVGQLEHCSGFEFLGNWRCCLHSLCSWFLWFEDMDKRNDTHNKKTFIMSSFGKSSEPSGSGNLKGRFWTNVLIGLNVLMFVAQNASGGQLLLLGAKINSSIDQGQLWRFLTPAFLHANVGHLLANCYSLNSIGPAVEAQGGPRRFLAVYIGSAVTGFAMSYFWTRAPAVGASGAVFGLVGAFAVFLLRHKHLLSGAQQSLSQIFRVITINLVLGLTMNNIDNWGHLGGLVGGAAISWFLGPSFSYKRVPGEGKLIRVDQPPISYLLPKARRKEP